MPPVTMVEEDDSQSGASTKVAADMREQEDDNLLNIINALAGEKSYEVRVYRTEPRKWNTPPVNVTGHLETFTEIPSEEELKLAFGGGAYALKFFRPDAKGSFTYFRQVTLKLPGKPHGVGIDAPESTVMDYGPPAEESGAVSQAMTTMQQLVADQRNDKGGGVAEMQGMMTTMMEPMKAQIAAAQAQLLEAQKIAAEKDARILELISKKPDTTTEEKFFHNMIDADGGRRDHARDMHESELRIMRENARDDIKRLEGRQHDALQSQEKAQQREIDNLTRSHDQTISTIKMSYDSIITSLKSDITRGERDLTKSDTELVSLRAVKEKTVIEQLSDMTAIKDAFSTIGGGDEPDDRTWYEKLAEASFGNPEKLGIMFNMVTGQGNPAQQQQPAQQSQQQQSVPGAQLQTQPPAQEQQQEYATIADIPLGVPFRGDDGQVYVKVPPDGSVVLYDHAKALAEEVQQNEGVDKPSPSEVKIAITFMENAFTSGTSPTDFAMSAKSMIPGSILKYMESVGIDKFLNEVANLDSGSPLRNQAGRTFMREVAKFLLEGVTV